MESPIEETTSVISEEVKEEEEEESKKNLGGRPKKNKNVGVSLLSLVEKIDEKLDTLSERVSDLEKYTESHKPAEVLGTVQSKPLEVGAENTLINTVKQILGQGEPDMCQFQVVTIPNKTGNNFRLVITPPDHLKEQENDTRVKVLSYSEGLSGAEMYTKLVLDRCIKHANQKAIAFFAK